MKKYATYKPSGLAWIGEVPSHWDVGRLKFLFSRSKTGVWGDDEKGNTDDIVCFRVADFDYESGGLELNDNTIRNIEKKALEGRIIQRNDLLIEKSGGGDLTPVGRVVKVNTDIRATCSNFIHIVSVADGNDPSFIYYYFKFLYSNKINQLFFNQTTGIQNLKVPDYLGQTIFLPPLAEQTTIANYLDAKCAKIDNVVSVQQKRIELLKELKQSIITKAVTKGLDKNAKMKDSGVDWIGEVPSHWDVGRLKFLFSRSKAGVWGDDEKGNTDDIVCFRVADFDYESGGLDLNDNTIRNIEKKALEGRIIQRNDLLIEKSGGGDLTPVGRVVKVNTDIRATCSNFIHVVSVADGNDSSFIYYYFKFLYSNKINQLFFNQTTGIQNLKVSDYLGQTFFLPRLHEQNTIVAYLDKKCATIDKQIQKVEKQIELLKEYKQSVITECVTGKRKVC